MEIRMKDYEFLKEGKLVSLRLSDNEDIPMIVGWRNKDRVRINHVYREDFTVDGQRAWKEKNIDTGKAVQFIICEKRPDRRIPRPVGVVHFHGIDKEEGTAEYGIYIGEEDALGKGYANEAADLALEYAKDVMGLKKVILRAFSSNAPAVKSYLHAGFTKTEDVPQVLCSDGQKGDMIIMEKSL
jgi:RimJ/RimL family protein N-acetyltransferase